MILILCFVLTVSSAIAGQTYEGGSIRKFSSVGHGYCGQLIDATVGLLASVGDGLWTNFANPNQDPLCGQCVEVSYNGQKVKLQVVDKCHDCANDDILVSAPAYEILSQTYPGPYELEGGSFQFVPCTPTTPPTPDQEINVYGEGSIGYYASAGNAACGGRVNGSSDWDWNVALSSEYFTPNSNNDPMCQKCVEANYGGFFTKLQIRDKCVGCPANRIMVSKQVMRKFAGNAFSGVHGAPSDYLPTAFLFSPGNGGWKVVSC